MFHTTLDALSMATDCASIQVVLLPGPWYKFYPAYCLSL